MLENLKLLLNIKDNSEDDKLNYILNKCTTRILNLTNINKLDMTEEHEDLVVELAVIRYNMLGNEGLSSESYSGISQNYLTDIPKDLLRRIKRIRKLP